MSPSLPNLTHASPAKGTSVQPKLLGDKFLSLAFVKSQNSFIVEIVQSVLAGEESWEDLKWQRQIL